MINNTRFYRLSGRKINYWKFERNEKNANFKINKIVEVDTCLEKILGLLIQLLQ